jgi:probable addiction module antidote protein
MQSLDYDDFLLKRLGDLDYAAGYLSACLEEGVEVFYLGLRQVAKAQGGMQSLSKATKLNRESLYGMLSKSGNPFFTSVATVLDTLGLELTLKPKGTRKKAA